MEASALLPMLMSSVTRVYPRQEELITLSTLTLLPLSLLLSILIPLQMTAGVVPHTLLQLSCWREGRLLAVEVC